MIDIIDYGITSQQLEEAKNFDGMFPARVISVHKDIYSVITDKGERFGKRIGKITSSNETPFLYTGDFVMVKSADDEQVIINHVLKRHSLLKRKQVGQSTDIQGICANIDTVFICMSLNQDYNINRLNRYITAGWDSGATPVVILTKADLCGDIDSYLSEIEENAVGIDVIAVSSVIGDVLEQLYKYLDKRKTICFVGSSGVGKSTLINKLCGQEIIRTNEIRDDGKGRHTTTVRELYMLDSGTMVIDTPGMREFGLVGGDADKTFSDIDELANQCKFRDCTHNSEKGCAVLKAIEDGQLDRERLDSYLKIKRELLYIERKQTMTAARSEKQKFIDIMGSANAYKEIKKKSRMK